MNHKRYSTRRRVIATRLITVVSCAALLLLLVVLYWRTKQENLAVATTGAPYSSSSSQSPSNTPSSSTSPSATPTATPKVSPTLSAAPIFSASASPLPTSAKLVVPFLVQAPFAKWDPLHEDACEETSLIMVHHFQNKTMFTKAEGDAEITNFVQYQQERGYGPSITLRELNTLAQTYYRMQSGRVGVVTTATDITRELAAGRPVIVGAAGKLLKNPYFSNGGPTYHMLVITGYDEQGFITNDPGVSQGKDFRYSRGNLLESIHDWDAANILNGPKHMLVFD